MAPFQAGGIRGRNMVDNIINLEHKALQSLISHQLLAGIFALDQAAAFPSIARRYIWWVFRRMAIPRKIRRLLRALYDNGNCGVSFAGRIYYYLIADAGVKQGDLVPCNY